MKKYFAVVLRIYPDKEQQTLIDKTIGCCRFLYNQMLAERIKVYEEHKHDKQEVYGWKYKTEKQYKEEFEFLKEIDVYALQQSRIHLDTAYNNFFKSLSGVRKGGKVGFPKFKKKKAVVNIQHYSNIIISDLSIKELGFQKSVL